ncbi:PHD finger protein ING1 [Hibiscus syriacus]|uniref:PHD finger protein ING n=1 Tax=Hibiscus syriacus TaxID=106335 RepID=A0A6A3CQS5_HIBSY|nr:PHD finger protein ING1 [Hibiscus syriacus]
MSFIDEFQTDLEALPHILQKKYALMRDLDRSLQEIVRENEQRCEQEIEDIKRGVRTETIRFSDEALDEQKHGIRIADEKVALAIQTYDLVRAPAPSPDGTTKSGRPSQSGRGGRKKTRLAAVAAASENPTGMELDLPVDPNEPTYCLCNQVSYGEMVACDNPNCKIEWFHFGCVDLREQPRGKWYCSDCAVMKNRRKGRSR